MKSYQDVKFLVINYHYIRDIIPEDGIHPIHPKAFENQLKKIQNDGYEFISLNFLNDCIINLDLKNFPKKGCMITFDDGLRESYEVGLKILDKFQIPAVFYIVTNPILNKKVLDVHKIQYIRSMVKSEELLLDAEKFSYLKNIKFDNQVIKNQYPWDDIETAKLKYILNFCLSNQDLNNYLDDWFKTVNSESETEFVEKLYLSKAQVVDLYKRGYLGTHTRIHHPLANLSEKLLISEIKGSLNELNSMVNGKILSISYPYGMETSVNKKVFEVCKNLGIISGFTMFRGHNSVDDILNNPLILKRFDTNDVYGGKTESKYDIY